MYRIKARIMGYWGQQALVTLDTDYNTIEDARQALENIRNAFAGILIDDVIEQQLPDGYWVDVEDAQMAIETAMVGNARRLLADN